MPGSNCRTVRAADDRQRALFEFEREALARDHARFGVGGRGCQSKRLPAPACTDRPMNHCRCLIRSSPGTRSAATAACSSFTNGSRRAAWHSSSMSSLIPRRAARWLGGKPSSASGSRASKPERSEATSSGDPGEGAHPNSFAPRAAANRRTRCCPCRHIAGTKGVRAVVAGLTVSGGRVRWCGHDWSSRAPSRHCRRLRHDLATPRGDLRRLAAYGGAARHSRSESAGCPPTRSIVPLR